MATKNGERWRVRWRVNGKERSKNFPKGTPKKLVDEWERKVRLKAIDRRLGTDEAVVVEPYCERFLEVYPVLHKRAPSTIRRDRFTIRDHVIPRFGDWLLRDITGPDIMAWQVDLRRTPLEPQTVNNAIACLSTIFGLALREGKVDYNPCKSVKTLPRPKQRPSFWTSAEAGRFLAHARVADYPTYQVCLLAICSGLRWGELAGLRRDCLDFDAGVIDNRRHYCTKERKVLPGLKNGPGYRVPVSRLAFDAIADKRGLASDDLVFPWLHKKRAFGHDTVQPLAGAAGVKPIKFHDLRHTFASHLAMAKKPALEIKELMGHQSLASTEVYMHLAEGTLTGATDCIADGLGLGAFTGGNVVNLHGSRR